MATNGILVNELGQLLLIQRNDTRTFALPGGGVEMGELPTDNIAREVQEETGIIAMPVRLVSLNYWPMKPDGLLTFTFRCLRRGGEIQTSPESPRVGFFATNELPGPMLAFSRKRIQQGLHHAGGAVAWWQIENTAVLRISRFILFHFIHRWLDVKRRIRKEPPYVPPPNWSVTVHTIVRRENGDVLGLENENGRQLPGGLVTEMKTPWQTAVTHTKAQTGLDVNLTDLSAVYIVEDSSQMTLVFTAVAHSAKPQNGQWIRPSAAKTYLHQILDDINKSPSETIFRKIKND